jgi:membrane associated rhomboid family serine protease
MDDSLKQFNDIPVSLFLAVSIIVVFSLYITTAIKTIPCGKDIMSLFFSNFVHIDPYHLMVNLFALYALSRVERELGAKKFISLIVFLLIFTSVTEVMIHKVYPYIPCSIGFSGVLFGIMTWELVSKKELDIVLIFTIIGMVVLPSIQNSKASLLGHAVGAVAGIVGGILWKKLSVLLKINK